MESLLILLCLYLVGALVIFPIWALVRISRLSRDTEELRDQTRDLRIALADTKRPVVAAPAAPVVPAAPAPVVVTAPIPPAPVAPPPAAMPAPIAATAEPPPLVPAPIASEPPIVAAPAAPRPVYTPPPPAPSWTDSINWEQFMGAKLFAWLGGLALFLGVAFFVKYSFEHNLIPPAVRVAIGFLTGAGLIVGGLFINRDRFAITSQTLIGAGVVSLYAVAFTCGAQFYNFLAPLPLGLLMALITTTAFLLAVRLGAPVIAILGILGGFLTPKLLSTGVDNPPGLFGYLALLDIGLVAVALRTSWRYLIPLGAAGTAILMMGWADAFFTAEKGPIAMTATLGFSVLFLIAAELARRREVSGPEYRWTAIAMPLVGFGFAIFFLSYDTLVARAGLYLGYILLLDLVLLVLAWNDDECAQLPLPAGLIVFLLLAAWTTRHLTDPLLPIALTFYLGFAALHTVFPYVLQRHRPNTTPSWWSQLFPPLALVLIMLPILRLEQTSFLVWPAILLADLIAIGAALVTASLLGVAAVLVLTLIATGACLFHVPAHMAVDSSLLIILGGFAVFFFAASVWLVRRLGDALPAGAGANPLFGDMRAQLPAFSALLPFLLLVMVCLRLAMPDPSMVFGLGLLLVLLVLGLSYILTLPWTPLCALVGLGAVEYAWHSTHLTPDNTGVPLVWYLAFYVIFSAYPFLFRRPFQKLTGPWATAALAGIVHFPLVHGIFNQHENEVMGLIPAAFSVLPLLSLVAVLKTVPADEPKRLDQLAWFGGAALLFITLIFPVQFDRQWLTIAWALEGAALLWLFHRVPHAGLRLVGTTLLVVAFARLSFNSAVLSYHLRGETPILNWYLYTYGLATAALFTGARLLAPPRDRVAGINAPALLNTLGVILAFFLLNIEIADYFTEPGARTLTFRFSGNFGRDMTYTIAWALFALGLLAAGLWRQLRAARYAAIALLSVVLLKLFFHDLARLEALYRIGALFGVAVIAILASFAYQRFQPSHEKPASPAS